MDIVFTTTKEIAKGTLSYMAVEMSGLNQMIPQLGSGLVGNSIASGVIYTGANELINLVSEGKSSSHLINNRWFDLLDDVVFYSTLAGGVKLSKVDLQLYNTLSGISPLDAEMNKNIVRGSVITSGRVLGNLIDSMPNLEYLRVIRHPSKNLK